MGIVNIDVNNISLYDNFDEEDPNAIILIRLLAWHIKSEKRKELKKMISEELMSVAWHPKRWWHFCVPDDEKKKQNPFFLSNALSVYSLRVLKTLQIVQKTC